MLRREELIAFEREIKELFELGQIHAPVHLSGGNEDDLIRIFKDIKPEDWVFSNHRSHYHALLKGIPPEWVKAEIIAGRSICLCNPDYHFYSSAIVGGNLPQAVGVAMIGQKVWCFVGDMAGYAGIFYECQKYAQRNDLPITFVIEDNGFSVNSLTEIVWGTKQGKSNIIRYQYKRDYPHQGTNKGWVTF